MHVAPELPGADVVSGIEACRRGARKDSVTGHLSLTSPICHVTHMHQHLVSRSARQLNMPPLVLVRAGNEPPIQGPQIQAVGVKAGEGGDDHTTPNQTWGHI